MPNATTAHHDRKLLILGCSDVKRDADGFLPALDRYDGPAYRVIRKFLRENQWPADMSIAVLSAQHGLFGVFKNIEDYDRRMDPATARSQADHCRTILSTWMKNHKSLHISLGKDYLPAVEPAIEELQIQPDVFEGAIGKKLNQVKTFLRAADTTPRVIPRVEGGSGKYLYFLPDWDDMLDPYFDFEADEFSAPARHQRQDRHCAQLARPRRMSDGMLLSLAQCEIQKGLLKQPQGTGVESLYPPPIRQHFGLDPDQYLFGDCGAFTYVNSDYPTMSIDRAVALYESYGFDFGAAVDHIPMETISVNGQTRKLTRTERESRIDITMMNAEKFIESVHRRKARFLPVGILHGLDADGYSRSVRHYYDLGYRHMAIGGLVPQSDARIKEIVQAVMGAADGLPVRPWIHLFGIYRPKLQSLFRALKVDSFDSATYFRKAWLRSDQNYLSVDGEWFSALRVPMTKDGRTLRKLKKLDGDIEQLRREEAQCLALLCQYDRDEARLEDVLEATLTYDAHLSRTSETQSMRTRYRRTLEKRPWRDCYCNFCREAGIHVLVFRGANRNRRRGAHNTLMLYGDLQNVERND